MTTREMLRPVGRPGRADLRAAGSHRAVEQALTAPDDRPPVPVSALELLARSDGELVAAQLAGSVGERFVHAHLAALRAGAALLEVTGRPRRRPTPRTVWDMVAAVAPELEQWTTFFAAGARLRAAIESGRDGVVDADRTDRTVAAAEDFQDVVRRRLSADAPAQGRLLPHAS